MLHFNCHFFRRSWEVKPRFGRSIPAQFRP